ncbi:MAG: hypothetical protein LBC28_03060 [Oscillospiraceae bacterium]|jgi:hypothetical protein|nr:hypothetical protein [Oscillospiraceae bacterium]
MNKPKPTRCTLMFARRGWKEYCDEPFRTLNRRYIRQFIICMAVMTALLIFATVMFSLGVAYFRYVLAAVMIFAYSVMLILSTAYDSRIEKLHRELLSGGAYITTEPSRLFVERRARGRGGARFLITAMFIALFAFLIIVLATNILTPESLGRTSDNYSLIAIMPTLILNTFNIYTLSIYTTGYPAIFTDEAIVVYDRAVRYDAVLKLDVDFTADGGSETRNFTARDGDGSIVFSGRIADEDYAHLQKMLDVYVKYASALNN